jgi:putative sigma-54 modulation protein
MIHTQLKATNMELTDSLRDYVTKRIASLEKFAKGDCNAYVEVGKSTNHHKSGDVFRAEINLTLEGKTYRATSDKNDLYAAVDEAKDDLYETITSEKDRNQTLWKRGARSVKKMLKGISKRNPFTSKY